MRFSPPMSSVPSSHATRYARRVARTRDQSRRRQELVSATAALVSRKGLSRVRLRDVADASRARLPTRVRRPRPGRRAEVHLARGTQLRQARARHGPCPTSDPLSTPQPGTWFERDPLWFKTSVFYE